MTGKDNQQQSKLKQKQKDEQTAKQDPNKRTVYSISFDETTTQKSFQLQEIASKNTTIIQNKFENMF